MWATQAFQLSSLSPMVVVTSGPPCQRAPLVSSHTRLRVVDMEPWSAAKSRVGLSSSSNSSGCVSNWMPRRTLSPAAKLGDSLMPVRPFRRYSPLSSFLYSNRVSTWPVTSIWAAKTAGAASDSTSAAVKRTAAFFIVIPLGVCDDAATHASWNWDEGCDGCCIDWPRLRKRPPSRESPCFQAACLGSSWLRRLLRRLICRSGQLGFGGLRHLLSWPRAWPWLEPGKLVTLSSAGRR